MAMGNTKKNMRYILMCGGDYGAWETPRQLEKICGEEIVARTIRLLRQNGVKDIAISSNNPLFEKFDVPVLKHENLYIANGFGNVTGDWFNCFYPTNEPVCYIFGDVVFSNEAIKTIVETETDDIEFFGSQPPFHKDYIKTHEEPFALKVMNQKHLHEAIEKTRELDKEHKFWRKPIVWELFTIIKNAPLQVKKGEYTTDYKVINDYTCDVDFKEDALKLNILLGGVKMVKCEVINQDVSIREFNRLRNIKRLKPNQEITTPNYFEVGDTFETDEDMASYLKGEKPNQPLVCVRILEVIPEKPQIKEEIEDKPKEKKTIKKEAKTITKKSKKVK